MTVIENLKRQLAEAAKEQQTMTNEKDTVTRQLTYTKAELERYQRDNADLAAQVWTPKFGISLQEGLNRGQFLGTTVTVVRGTNASG